MSIELLPPDPEYPDAYHVRSNWCSCHPETCCCNDWAVHGPDGEKHSTHFHRETADMVAETLNTKLPFAYAEPIESPDGVPDIIYHHGTHKPTDGRPLLALYTHPAPQPAINQEYVERALHYPECWDTAAYPTVFDALIEVTASFICTNQDTHPAPQAEKTRPHMWHALRHVDGGTCPNCDIEQAEPQAGKCEPSRDELLGAIARGWCHGKNAHKEMDTTLAVAIADEILAIYPAPQPAKVGPEWSIHHDKWFYLAEKHNADLSLCDGRPKGTLWFNESDFLAFCEALERSHPAPQPVIPEGDD